MKYVLNVNGKMIPTKELTYDDMVVLGKEFYKCTGELVCDKTCKNSNNLPSIIKFK